MRLDKFLKNVAPVIAMAMAASRTGSCDGKFSFNGKEGVKLDELDLSGDAPEAVNLMGPDIVRIVEGADFSVALEGEDEAKARMRFIIEGGTLSVLRDNGWGGDSGQATVTVTMPAPKHLAMAGSGELHAETLARNAEVTIAGSGRIETPAIDVESLEVSIAGSGLYRASGVTGTLDLSIAGSGSADLRSLKAATAEISIAGSGDADFSSDGTVRANIMGSGNVTVRGSATCKVRSFGSGTLICERGSTVENA